MDRKQLTKKALVGIVALGITAAQTASAAPKWSKKGQTLEKCAGIAKSGKNDCGTKVHDCAGKSVKDNDPDEWVYVPEGVCEKITGATVSATKKI